MKRRGAPSAARRAGRCRQSRGRERGTRPFPAATPLPPLPLPPLPPRPYGRGGRGKKPNAPRRFWRRGGSRTTLEGRGGSLGTAGSLWARGLAQAAAGRAGRQRGTKKPLLSRIRAKILRKILQFAPPCVILCMPRNSISKAVRYKRAFLYLFFLVILSMRRNELCGNDRRYGKCRACLRSKARFFRFGGKKLPCKFIWEERA